MKTTWALIGIFCFCLGLGACRQALPELPVAGVSRDLAVERKAVLKDLHYELYFRIPASKTERVEGQVTILFNLEQPEQIVLDFREEPACVKSVQVNGEMAEIQVMNEHIVIPEERVKRGTNRIEIGFLAGDQSLNRNEDYLYTLLVPDRARTLFPCFDQPDLKAIYRLELDIPESWVAVANGPVEMEVAGSGRKRIIFQETQPLSSYLFSFVAGRWEKQELTRDGCTVALYYRETDSVKLAQTGIIFNQVFAALEWMEEYTGIPYPFTKYDLVIVPGFQFGGMEHPGAVLYNDKRMFLEKHPTVEEELGRMELIAHETAHMWFGDGVTMAWFDDVWTKEVFANYFAARMTEPQFPQVNHSLNALRSFFPAAYSEDRTEGTNAIRQALGNLNDAGLVYGQIVYNKAPIVMTMLVRLMGEENFQLGIQEYLRTYAYSNATWDDLIGILDRYTPENLIVWSRVWVDEKGMPEISASYQHGELVVQQKDRLGRGLVWPQQVCYTLFRKPVDGRSNYDTEILTVDLKDSVCIVPTGPDVEYIVPNTDGQGYGYFAMDSVAAAFCLGHLAIFTDPVARLSVLISLNENRLNGRLRTDDFTKLLLKHLEIEDEPLIYSAVIGYVKDACLRRQMGKNTDTEHKLLELAKRRGDGSKQQVAFRALLDVWTSPDITRDIYQIWNRQQKYSGLILSERDEMKMAYELAVRMPEENQQLIQRQTDRIQDPDRRREFCYIAQAVVPETAVRDSLFSTLLNAENRQIEPWVAQMMYYLNHPVWELQSVKYIAPALENLPDIQRTGDIFFPKNWITASLQGHRSSEAIQVIREFIQQNPDFPVLLKNKILQSADHLYRKDICKD